MFFIAIFIIATVIIITVAIVAIAALKVGGVADDHLENLMSKYEKKGGEEHDPKRGKRSNY